MRNKYLTNRIRRHKYFKKAKHKERFWPDFMFHGEKLGGGEERFIEECERIARRMDKGGRKGWNHAPKKFRKRLDRKKKREEKNLMRHGKYNMLTPRKKDADWLWF